MDAGGIKFTGTASWSKTSPLFQDAREFTSPLYNKTSSIPGVNADGGSNRGGILAAGVNAPSAVNPTGTSATATSVSQLIANGTYVPTTPGAVAQGFDVSKYQTLLLGQELQSFVLTADSKLFGTGIGVVGDFMLSPSKRFTQLLSVPAPKFTGSAGGHYNPLTTNINGITFDDLGG